VHCGDTRVNSGDSRVHSGDTLEHSGVTRVHSIVTRVYSGDTSSPAGWIKGWPPTAEPAAMEFQTPWSAFW